MDEVDMLAVLGCCMLCLSFMVRKGLHFSQGYTVIVSVVAIATLVAVSQESTAFAQQRPSPEDDPDRITIGPDRPAPTDGPLIIRVPTPQWYADQTRVPPLPPLQRRTSTVVTERLWKRVFAMGISLGVGSPVGWFGGFVEINVAPIAALQLGGGSGGNFGPAVASMLLLRPIRIERWAFYGGIGASFNFTPRDYLTDPTIFAANFSAWGNLETGLELRLRAGILLRFAIGGGVLLNPTGFQRMGFIGFFGNNQRRPLGLSPYNVVDAQQERRTVGVFFTHIDVAWLP